MPFECTDARYIYNPELPSVPVSSLEVRVSGQGETSGRGIYTKQDVPPHAYIAPEVAVDTLHFWPFTTRIIEELYEDGPVNEAMLERDLGLPWKGKIARQCDCVYYYMHSYGFTSRKHVSVCFADFVVQVNTTCQYNPPHSYCFFSGFAGSS